MCLCLLWFCIYWVTQYCTAFPRTTHRWREFPASPLEQTHGQLQEPLRWNQHLSVCFWVTPWSSSNKFRIPFSCALYLSQTGGVVCPARGCDYIGSARSSALPHCAQGHFGQTDSPKMQMTLGRRKPPIKEWLQKNTEQEKENWQIRTRNTSGNGPALTYEQGTLILYLTFLCPNLFSHHRDKSCC